MMLKTGKIWKLTAAALVVLLFFACGALAAVLRSSPGLAAAGADQLRRVLGGQITAQIEGIVFKLEDTLTGFEYRTGLARPKSPWEAGTPAVASPLATPFGPTGPIGSQPPASASPGGQPEPAVSQPGGPAAPAEQPWSLAPIPPLGSLPGEGQWIPYLQDAAGRTVATKTFLQSDPQRPYAVVGIVAFDLRQAQLHFVLGRIEPYAKTRGTPHASGSIPTQEMVPGVLLAAFNGGFKYEQGHFGAMAAGLVSAPLRDGLASLAITPGGNIEMGAWGTDLSPTAEYQAVRQNGPLAIAAGQISPDVAVASYWGYTISGATATWRSGLALSKDGRTLYYFAGPYLTIHTLTRAMMQAGVWNAMQLDINDYWVHFDAFPPTSSRLVPEPLFPGVMTDGNNRFLRPYDRDFFYITAKNHP